MVAEPRPSSDDPSGPYARAALEWFDAGWSPLPLPPGAKWPPPEKYTGKLGADPDRKQVRAWIRENPDGNLCIRVPPTVIGIDVDTYAQKHGDATLAELEKTYGKLPPAKRRTSSRGPDNPSGIRWYRIREGTTFPGVLGPGVEVIQFHHRYAVAPPSIHPETGEPYATYNEDDERVNDIFSPDDLDEVPQWFYDVQAVRGAGLDKHTTLTSAEVAEWLDDEANRAHYCRAMHNVLQAELTKLEAAADTGESRYDTARDGCMAIVRLSQEGHRGATRALERLSTLYADLVDDEPNRDPGEWRRMLSGAVEAVAEHMAEAHPKGACPDRAIIESDPDPALWPSPKDPLEVARRFVAERYTDGEFVTLAFWRGDFYRWVGPHWALVSEDAMRAELYAVLGGVSYMSAAAQPIEITFSPNKSKVAHVTEALQALTLREDDDGRADCIHFANGALWLNEDGTRELAEHSPEQFNLTSLPYDYSPDAPEPKQWLHFLDELFGDDPEAIRLLQQWFGYVISGDTAQQKMMMLIGPPRAGKGIIARVLTALIGRNNVAGPTLAQIGTNFGLQSIIGKSLAVIGDARFAGQSSVVVERLLSITGEDTITIDRKNRDPWTGRVDARLMVLSNELPSLAEASGALASRFAGPLVLRQSWLGREDLHLERRLLSELSGIMAWALDGADDLYESGYFAHPDSSRTAMRDLQELSSPETAFMRECCRRRAGAHVPTAELYRAFARWCEGQGRRNVPTFPIFARNLKAAFPDLVFTRSAKGYAQQTRIIEDVELRENTNEFEIVR